MKHLIAILFTACALAQTGSWPTPATDQDLVVAKTGATSTLTAGINASTLTVTVADGSKFAQYSIIRIDDEYMQICSIATNTLTICSGTRGLVGSAASHLDGATVRDVVSEYHHNRTRVEIKAMQAKLLPVTSGTSAPGTCAANRELFVDRDASPNPTLHLCNATGDGWLTIAGGGGVTCAVGPTGALVEDADCEFDIDTAIVPTLDGANDWTGANDFSGASKTSPFRIGAADPGTCDATAREMFYNTTSNVLKVCNATNTWTAVSGGASSITEYVTFLGGSATSGTNLALIHLVTGSVDYGVLNISPPMLGAVAFLRGAPTVAEAQIYTVLPSTWTGAITLQAFTTLAADSSGTGTYVLGVRTICATPGTDTLHGLSSASFNAAQTIEETIGSVGAGQIGKLSSLATLTTTGCSAGDILFIRLIRDAATWTNDTATDKLLLGFVRLAVTRTL